VIKATKAKLLDSRSLGQTRRSLICLIGSMVNKTTTTRFEVEKFNSKGNFSSWQRRVKMFLRKEILLKTLHDKENKPNDMTNAV